MPGGPEIWVICGIVVLLFGAGQIPKIARSIGKAKREFNEGMSESESADSQPTAEDSGESK